MEEKLRLNVWWLPSPPVVSLSNHAALATEEEYPNLIIQFRDDDLASTVFDALTEGRADVGIAYSSVVGHGSGLVCEEVARLPICAWVRSDNPVLDKNPQGLKDLAGCVVPQSLVRQAIEWTDSMVEAFKEVGYTPEVRVRPIYDQSGFFRTLRADEVLLDFEGSDVARMYNANLVKIPLEGGGHLRPVIVAYRAQENRPYVLYYINQLKAAAGNHM